MGYVQGGLTFNALREANKARMPQFRNRHGQLSHSKPDGSDWSPAHWLQALIGEIGEYANLRKKFERGDVNETTFKVEAAKELADVMIYLDILAMQLGINLGQATVDKFNEVSTRVGASVRLATSNPLDAADPYGVPTGYVPRDRPAGEWRCSVCGVVNDGKTYFDHCYACHATRSWGYGS